MVGCLLQAQNNNVVQDSLVPGPAIRQWQSDSVHQEA
jgi:hypothetical protein